MLTRSWLRSSSQNSGPYLFSFLYFLPFLSQVWSFKLRDQTKGSGRRREKPDKKGKWERKKKGVVEWENFHWICQGWRSWATQKRPCWSERISQELSLVGHSALSENRGGWMLKNTRKVMIFVSRRCCPRKLIGHLRWNGSGDSRKSRGWFARLSMSFPLTASLSGGIFKGETSNYA